MVLMTAFYKDYLSVELHTDPSHNALYSGNIIRFSTWKSFLSIVCAVIVSTATVRTPIRVSVISKSVQKPIRTLTVPVSTVTF